MLLKAGYSMVQPFNFHLPTKIVFSEGSLNGVGVEAAALGKRCIVVTGRTFARKSGYLRSIERQLTESGLEVVTFDMVEPNPSIETAYRGAAIAKNISCDVVVAFGGGSAIDAAKTIAFLALNEVLLENKFAPNEATEPSLPLVAIPTTCGTGSEVTRYAVLSDLASKKKKTLFGTPLIPRVALLDPNVLESLPKQLIAYTAFDALSHSFEALLSKSSSSMSDLFAKESIIKICRNLEMACEGCPNARSEVFYGSMLAGLAINSTGTVVVHGMGYYLTNYHGIHHGLANAVLLNHVLMFEGEVIREKLEDVAIRLGLQNLQDLFELVEKIAEKVGIPKSLTELGVDPLELDSMVSDAMSYKRNLENNPVSLSEEDIRALYKKAFAGAQK